MSEAAFVITGCGRSGTGYAAALLSAAGRACGHEVTFTPVTREVPPSFRAPVGDSSWLAAPFVSRLPPATVVVHIVRDPLEVVRSHLGIRFFSMRSQPPIVRLQNAVELARRAAGARRHRYVRAEFLRFVERHDASIVEPPTELERCLAYWIRWNRLVERGAADAGLPYVRVAVERIDADVVGDLLARIGTPPDPRRVGVALADVPRSTNSRTRDERVRWEHLASVDPHGSIAALAARYGYETDR